MHRPAAQASLSVNNNQIRKNNVVQEEEMVFYNSDKSRVQEILEPLFQEITIMILTV